MFPITKIETVDQYDQLFGLETLHPLVNVIDFSKATIETSGWGAAVMLLVGIGVVGVAACLALLKFLKEPAGAAAPAGAPAEPAEAEAAGRSAR